MSNTNHDFHPTALAAVNEALIVLGQDVTLEELSKTSATVNSRKAAFLYETSRMKVLRDHDWNFATEELTIDSCHCDCLEGAMPYHSQKPPRCVRVLACKYGGELSEWRIVGNEIHSSLPIDCITYIKDIEDLNRWTPDAYRALVLRLAADLAKPITGRINERQMQEEAYQGQVQTARLSDAKEANVPYDAWGENHYVKAMRGESRLTPDFRR